MKGDKVTIVTQTGEVEITATTNGSAVEWEMIKDGGIQWLEAREMSKAGKRIRNMKFKADFILGVIEHPAKAV